MIEFTIFNQTKRTLKLFEILNPEKLQNIITKYKDHQSE